MFIVAVMVIVTYPNGRGVRQSCVNWLTLFRRYLDVDTTSYNCFSRQPHRCLYYAVFTRGSIWKL